MIPNETQIVAWQRGPYTMNTDRSQMDIEWVHHSLSHNSYWSRGIPMEAVNRSIEGSISLGIYFSGKQIGFARIVTDCVRLAYLMDVYIDRDHRGNGLGTWLAQVARTHPDLSHIQRWLLSTLDAHAVYEKAGWKPVAKPEWMMEVMREATDA